MYKKRKMRITTDLLYDILNFRKDWNNVFILLNKNYFQVRVYYPEKL